MKSYVTEKDIEKYVSGEVEEAWKDLPESEKILRRARAAQLLDSLYVWQGIPKKKDDRK